MKDHYDVGIVGCWYWGNYGSLLNGYATAQVIKSFGLSPLNIITPYNGFERHAKRFFEVAYDKDDISPLYDFDRVPEFNKYCDSFLTGSDQIWHYNPNKEDHRFADYFRLNFAEDGKRKLSFATSFGNYKPEPEDAHIAFTKLFQRYTAISVRESEGVEICRDRYGVNATQVIEPVFDITRDEWLRIAEHSEYNEKEPYMLTYILDPTPEKRAAVQYYSKELGVKAINILDGFEKYYEHNSKALDLPNMLPTVWCADLLKLYSGAQFVLTDSFHGACFSLIFNKPFIAVGNYMRGIKRFESLLSLVGMSERLIHDPKAIPHDRSFLEPMDFTHANEVIAGERQRSVDWLKNALLTPVEKMPPIRSGNFDRVITRHLETRDCVGCGACMSVCPKGAIELKQDDYGYYRSVIDFSKCINCGLCKKVCPALTPPENTNTETPDCYEFIADKDLVMKSSSGGASSVLAREAFRRGGAVVGVAWRDDFSVEHIMIESEDELPKIQKSKYLQSYTGDIDKRVKEQLDKGRFVMFVGCACQIAGLKAYLGKDYENLLTIDLLCANAPSAKFFQKYIKDSFPDGLSKYTFRYKDEDNKWSCLIVNATDNEGKSNIRHGGREDDYQRVFHNHTMCSHHCQNCKFQAAKRYGDLTIGDYWGIHKHDPYIDSKYGVSCIIVNNEKGRRYLESIPASDYTVLKKGEYAWLGGNGMTKNGKNYISPYRDAFYNAIRTMPFGKAVDHALGLVAKKAPDKISVPAANPLQFSANILRFGYDPSFWEQVTVDGRPLLYVKQGEWKSGRYATLSLDKPLKKKKTYEYIIRFKAKSASSKICFYLKDSNSRVAKELAAYKMPDGRATDWVTIKGSFTPSVDGLGEFMLGASQFTGEGNFITFDLIFITE